MARSANKVGTAVNLGFETKLWQAADKLRSNMDAAEYKHVLLIFLRNKTLILNIQEPLLKYLIKGKK